MTTVVAIRQGGTGQVTRNAALNALLPDQTGIDPSVLISNATDASWLGYSPTNINSAVVQRDGGGNFAAGMITADLDGNAATSTALETPRAINGVNFDGSEPITVTADANTLTGTVLNDTVVDSSLQSLGLQNEDLNMNSHRITNVTNPSSAQDAATKAYVDASGQVSPAKAMVELATTAALPANTYNNGASGVGATLTADANGVLTVDGQEVVVDNRIWVKNEAEQKYNGIYKCTTEGTSGVPYVLTRATDADSTEELAGAYAEIRAGTQNATTLWAISNANNIIINSSNITSKILSVDSTTVTLTGSQTLTNKTITTPIVVGITNGAAASAGNVGEILQTIVASGDAVSLTTATVGVVASVAYTAGKWEVTANPTFIGTGITATELQGFLSTASGTSTTGQTTDNTSFGTPFAVGVTGQDTTPITYQFNTSGSGTLYLKAKATFTVGACTAYGALTMRRVG